MWQVTDGSASSSEKGSQKQVIQSHKESLFSPSPPFEGKGNALASFMLLEYNALKKTAYGRKCLFGCAHDSRGIESTMAGKVW